jgi:hypothetical protein
MPAATASEDIMIARKMLLLIATAAAAGALPGLGIAEEITPRDLTVEQNAVYLVQPAPATAADPLRVTAWVDQNDNTYTVGETVRLFVQANKEAYITVLDTGPSGKTVQLFPNASQADNHVKAGQTIAVPGLSSKTKIVASGPVGIELIKIVASTTADAVVAPARTVKAGDFLAVTGGAEATAKDLALAVAEAPKTGGEVDVYNKLIRTVEAVSAQPVAAAPPAPAPAPAAPAQPSATPAATTGTFTLQLGTDKSTYKVGDAIAIAVTPSETCHLTLVNINAAGQAVQLFPNKVMSNDLLQAGQTVLLPGAASDIKLQLQGPAGTETLVGVCSKDTETVLSQPVAVAEVFPRLGNGAEVTRSIAAIQSKPAVATTKITFTVSQ